MADLGRTLHQAQHRTCRGWRAYQGSERPVFSFLVLQAAKKKLFIASFRHLLVAVEQHYTESSFSINRSVPQVYETQKEHYSNLDTLLR